MKKEIRILGIDDAPFIRKQKKKVLVVGTIFRGGHFMDGVISTHVVLDGTDATEKLVALVRKTKHKPQLQAIMLNGISMGGFNIIDIRELSNKTKLPVIVVIRKYPDFKKIRAALIKIGFKNRIQLLDKAGAVHKIGKVYVQLAGISLSAAAELIRITSTHAHIPEPIRAAHLIASGIVDGESRGGA